MGSTSSGLGILKFFVVASVALASRTATDAFTVSNLSRKTPPKIAMAQGGEAPENEKGFLGFIGEFFDELDAFVDDATSRRLGAGSAFYGKRRSNFYGKNDKNKKRDRNQFNITEDYAAAEGAGYFKWMLDDDGQMRPVTRMKEKIVEKRSAFRDE
jgi:hypothetical protein